MTACVSAYLGLGANLGERGAAIAAAITALAATPGVEVTASSTLHETSPVGPGEQPPYLNAAAAVRTVLSPRALLEACLGIEARAGRDRRRETRWGPRCLDIDLLLYGDRIIAEPGLRVPHPRLHERSFVLEPLAEIAPRVVHPGLARSIESLREATRAPIAP